MVSDGHPDRPALARCIKVGADTFAADFWARRPLLSRAAELPRDFSDLMSPEAVDDLVSTRGLRTPFVRMAHEGTVLATSRFTAPGGAGAEIGDQVSADKVLREFAAGATLVLQALHRTWPPIVRFTEQLIRDLGHPAQVNAYVTPASARGFDAHYDVHDVFVLQVDGEKRWVVHEPVHRHPLAEQPWTQHRRAVGAQAGRTPAIDTVLSPGDALYLPRGWLHSATALGGTTIHLTVGMPAFTRYDVARALLEAAADSEPLRESLPLGLDLRDLASVAPEIDAVVKLLAERFAGSAASDVSRYLVQRFDQATRYEPVSPLRQVATADHLDAMTTVRWRSGLAATLEDVEADDGQTAAQVRLVLPGRSLRFPAVCRPALQSLMDHSDRSLADVAALPDLDLPDAQVIVGRLLREGVVVPLDE